MDEHIEGEHNIEHRGNGAAGDGGISAQRQHDKARSVERREHDVVDYQMRPSPPTKPKLCVAGPF